MDEVINYTKAGGACGKCHGEINKILTQNLEPNPESLTKTQMILKINNVIDKHISNELRKDGGDIELVDVEDNKIFVKMTGKCKSCKRQPLTLTHFVEATLKEHIGPDIEVIRV